MIGRLTRAEWTKLRTVRGWVITMLAALLVPVLLGLTAAAGSHSSCSNGPIEVPCPAIPVSPNGEAINDRYFYANQSLAGDGSITVRVNSMTGRIKKPPPPGDPVGPPPVPGMTPWAKAGVMIKENTKTGSPYAAMMVTAEHGVRMQDNYIHDTAGRMTTTFPLWLRLTRTGETLTGYESADGKQWSKVGTARLEGLPATVRIGLFAASPGEVTIEQGILGGTSMAGRFAEVTAAMDQVALEGVAPGGTWRRDDVNVTYENDGKTPHHPGGLVQSGQTFNVTGVGDIGPAADAGGVRTEFTLTGAVTGLIMVIIVAVMFITTEYRRGLIRTSMLASPRRGRLLAAKALVVGTVTFVVGLVTAAIVVPVGTSILRSNGNPMNPVSTGTELRVIAGFAALLALSAVLALAVGALLRRSVAAVATALVLIVLPYILATVSFLPAGAAQWLMRLTPAAGFSMLQSATEYDFVLANYTPSGGYYPLGPWGGLAVLGAYAALALALAVVRVRRSDV